MLLSRLFPLWVLLGTFGFQLHASNPISFELRPDFSISPDTTTCPDDFLIDLGEDIFLLFGQTTDLYLVSNRSLDGDEQWLWSDPTHLSCLMCPTPFYSPTESTLLTLTIIDGDGCMASTELFVEVVRDDDIFVPNIFSPNDDGVNDVLTVYTGIGVEQIIYLRIFSRKGDSVFEQYNFRGDEPYGWDGSARGKPVDSGTFIYMMEVELIDGSLEQITGTITVVR